MRAPRRCRRRRVGGGGSASSHRVLWCERMDGGREFLVRWFDKVALVHLAEDLSQLVADLLTPLISLFQDTKCFLRYIFDARIFARAYPLFREGLQIFGERDRFSGVRHAFEASVHLS